jgi:hypothetical protein
MATNQENIITTIKAKFGLTDLSLTYTEALFTLFQEKGVTNTEFNGAFIEYLQLALSSFKTDINDLLAEYSQLHFDGNVSSINDLSLVVSSDNNYLFQDGTEFFFQNDTQFNFN